MNIIEIRAIARELNISETEEHDCFKAAVIILYGLFNNTVSKNKIKRGTDYWWKDVHRIIENLWDNDIIYEYQWNLDLEIEENNWMELILCSMAGAGILKRQQKQYETV